MNIEEFSNKIEALVEDIYQESVQNQGAAWKDMYKKVDGRLAENASFINEATADWTIQEWKELFIYQINIGNPDVFAFIASKIEELTQGQYFKECIAENISVLEKNVYSCDDKEALQKSDMLLSAVKALNRISSPSAKAECEQAFRTCDTVNEHILYELAEYVAAQCVEKLPALIEDESIEGDKLVALLSMCIQENKKSDDIYGAMKRRFKKLPDNSETKDIFAAIFGDYGEPNAIMMLRKFAKTLIASYAEDSNRETFSRIMMVMSVIEGLGGITDDLMP